MLENKKLGDVHYSRVIASWTQKYPGHVYFGETFKDWLRNLGATEVQVSDIYEMATCGRLELEFDAERFIKKQKAKKIGDFEYDD
jgi:hypothetical protein